MAFLSLTQCSRGTPVSFPPKTIPKKTSLSPSSPPPPSGAGGGKEKEERERKEKVNRKIASQKAISIILRREATKAVIEKKQGKTNSKKLLPRTVLGALHERITALRWESTLKVATLAPNIPAMYELHFGVPMAGAVLCTLNIRHDSAMVSVLLKHSEAKVIFVDYQLLEVARGALNVLFQLRSKMPLLILISELDNSIAPRSSYSTSNNLEYESLLRTGQDEFQIRWPGG